MAISDKARELFLAELATHGYTPTLLPDGAYQLDFGDNTLTVNLENKGREFDETGDADIIKHFVATVLAYGDIIPHDWETAKPNIYFAAEPSDHDFGDTCRLSVSDQVELVLVYLEPDGQHIVWLTPDTLKTFGVTREAVEHQAALNLARLLDRITLTPIDLGEHTLASFETDSPLKASLIFAPNLREKAEPLLGWPIYAVIPCRDFVFLIPEAARELFGGIGSVVVKEYLKRGYPITTEVFQIDSEKVAAIGEFQSPYNPPKGMRAIEHDNCLTFFLPRAWDVEEHEEDVIYFNPDEEDNYLSVIVKLFESDDDFPEDMAHQALQPFADEENVEVKDWPGQRATVHYSSTDDDRRSWTWLVAGPVTPKHQAFVAFTYHLPVEEADTDASQATITMLHEMLPRALFRTDFLQETDEEEDAD